MYLCEEKKFHYILEKFKKPRLIFFTYMISFFFIFSPPFFSFFSFF